MWKFSQNLKLQIFKRATELHELFIFLVAIEFGITALSRKVYSVTSDFRWNIWIYGSFFSFFFKFYKNIYLWIVKIKYTYFSTLKNTTHRMFCDWIFSRCKKKIRLLYSNFLNYGYLWASLFVNPSLSEVFFFKKYHLIPYFFYKFWLSFSWKVWSCSQPSHKRSLFWIFLYLKQLHFNPFWRLM